MKLKRIVSLLITSWVVLSSGFYPIAYADPQDPMTIIDPTVQNQTDPVQQTTASTQETTLTNTIDSSSTSGDTTVADNTAVESASSGEATVVATVVNIDSQSSTGLDQQIQSYSLSPTPNSNGDITFTIDTSTESTTQPLVTIPLTTDSETVNNLITLASTSGGVTADSNTSIGQLSTGDAYANANVINILCSNISAPQIFLGYITVSGDLTGDILLSDALLQSALDNSSSYINENNGISSNQTYALANDISAKATSGAASVSKNSSVGDIGSGLATNMLATNNLIGLDVYGQTGLLIFVNVTGDWGGKIIGQDKGVNAALIGVSSASGPVFIPLSSDQQALINLNNIINITSQSGDITATRNSSVGDIKTGDAITVVNIANIIGSNLVFSKNFGILFITVLGNWYGSFGIDTPYGGQKTSPTDETTQVNNQSPPSQQQTSRTFFSIKTNMEHDQPNTPTLETPQDNLYSYDSDYENNNSIKSHKMTNDISWIIPFIGGSIALGLLQVNKKTRIRRY